MSAVPTPLTPFETLVAELRGRFDAAQLACSRLTGQREATERRARELTEAVGAAKGRLSLAEEVQHVLKTLQQRAHERSLGAFERLLTAILRDVLKEKGDVRLVLSMRGNAPALDVRIDNQGNLEDALDGNGGAVANVLSAGLRFAALSRTGNRRFMVLDEPDCWITPDRVPSFVTVLAQVSAAVDVQTFVISHHDAAIFEGQVNRVQFVRDDDGRVSARALAPVVTDWTDDAQQGIRSVELENFRAHEHTVVPCFPGATAFIGDNDLGKSTALVSALRAVAYGESDDSMIRHGATEARVTYTLEGGRRLVWTRNVKRNPVVLYQLYEGDTLVQEGRPSARNSAPQWVTDELGIARVDDLDVQLGNQKSPVFLLDQSSSRRAQILSVGRESGHLSALMARYDELKRGDRDQARNGEIELKRVNYALACAKRLDEAAPLLESARPKLLKLEAVAERSGRLAQLLARIEAAARACARHEAEMAALAELPEVPKLHELSALERAIARLAVAKKRAISPPAWETVQVPELAATESVRVLIERLSRGALRLALAEKLPEQLPEVPRLHELDKIRACGERLAVARKRMLEQETLLKQVCDEQARALAEVEALKEELGGHCPLCGSGFPHEGIEHGHDRAGAGELAAA